MDVYAYLLAKDLADGVELLMVVERVLRQWAHRSDAVSNGVDADKLRTQAQMVRQMRKHWETNR